MSSRKSGGFTIVELLVVITIIGILMALLFPAINAAREGARKGSCISNQRQVGTAVTTYTTTRGKGDFPKHLNVKSTHNWPWVANVMAELGRGDIADAMLTDQNPANRTEYIEILVCPSDPPVSNDSKKISYVANAGLEPIDDATIADGIFQQTKSVSLSYVAQNDGTSTTLLISENVDATDWNHNNTANVYESAIIWSNTAPAAGCGLNQNTGSCTGNALARPRSNHSGGFVVTFCDGHTEFISQEIGYDVYKLIMTPNGSQSTHAQTTPLDEDMLRK
jgi:prepilin-type N-terminal cleavage/methylation domain-containing protein/prepilin-type processing-associated H-X9-DG protein